MADGTATAKRLMGEKKYTALDFMKAHPIEFGGEAERGALGQSAAMRKENKTFVLNSQGDLDWGYINGTISDDGTEIKKAPVRMQIGYQVGESKAGAGYSHIKHKREGFIAGKRYSSVEAGVADVLGNANFIVKEVVDGRDRIKLVKDLTPRTSVMLILDLDDGNEFYTIISFLPQSKKQVKDEKNKALLFNGSVRPLSASGDGAFSTPNGSIAGTEGDSVARKSNASDTVSLTEADKLVKKFTYPDEESVLNQSAWHGAPHSFNSFDLGSVGSGECEQGTRLHKLNL